MITVVYFSGIPYFQMKSMEICAKSFIRELSGQGMHVVEKELSISRKFSRAKPKILWEFVFRYIAYPFQAWRTGKHHGSDCIYVLGDHANAFIFLFLPKKAKKALHLHDLTSILPMKDLPFPPTWQNRLIHVLGVLFKKPGIKRADMIFSPSNYTREDILRHLDIEKNRLHVIPNGLDHEVFRPMDRSKAREVLGLETDRVFLMTVAPPTPRKNVPTLLRAMNVLMQCGFDCTLLLVGGLDTVAEKLADELKITEKITVFKNMPIPDIVNIYNSADIYVFPSFLEGFGIPVIEAMACGVPVVSSNSSSLPEVLGEAGLYFDPHDHQELADLIQNLLSDNSLKRTMIERGLKRAKSFSWKSSGMDLYRMLVDLDAG